MKKKYIVFFIRVVVSTALITYFIGSFSQNDGGKDINAIIQAFLDAPLYWLLPAGLLHIVGICLLSMRWRTLLRVQGVNPTFIQLCTYYIMAAFFNNFLPSTIGGDAMRSVESRKITGSVTTSVMVILVERFTGMMALVLVAATGLVIASFSRMDNGLQPWITIIKIFCVFAVIIILAHPRVTPRILRWSEKLLPKKIQAFFEKSYNAVKIYYSHPLELLKAQGVAVLIQINMVVYFYLIAKALNQSPDSIEFMVKIPVLIFLLMTIPSVNGIGVRTAGFKGLLGFHNVYALAVESIDLGFRIFYGLVGGIVFLFYKNQNSSKKQISASLTT